MHSSSRLGLLAAVSTLMAMVAQSAMAEEKTSPQLQKVTVRDGGEIHYVEPGEGVPVVFIHCGLHDYSEWNDQLDAFTKKYHTVAYSRRYSYRNSSKLRTNQSAVVDAEDLVALLRSLDVSEKVHVVGHSYGAYTGLFLTVKHPEMVRTLTLWAPPILTQFADPSFWFRVRTIDTSASGNRRPKRRLCRSGPSRSGHLWFQHDTVQGHTP